MLSQLISNKKASDLLLRQLQHSLNLSRTKISFLNNTIKYEGQSKIQLRFYNDGNSNSSNETKNEGQIPIEQNIKNNDLDTNNNTKVELENDYDDIDNPKPLSCFENVRKEAEKKRINELIYQFPNNPEEIFRGIKKVKLKDILLYKMPIESLEQKIIPYEENDINLKELPYLYNQNTLNEIQLICEGLINPAILKHTRLIPSQSSKIMVLSCPIKGSDIYLKNIAKHTAKQLKANFIELSNSEVFNRINGNIMKIMPTIETVEMAKSKKNPEIDSIRNKRSEPSFNSMFPMFNEKRMISFDKSNNSKVPYPIFRNYEDSKGNIMTLVNKNFPWPMKDVEINSYLLEIWIELFSSLVEISKSRPIVIFYEDLLSLFNGQLDKQDVYEGINSMLSIVDSKIILITPSTPTFEKKVIKSNNRFGPIFEDVSQSFRAPDIDAERNPPKNKMPGSNNENDDKLEARPIEFNTILDSFVGVTVIPVFPSFQKESEFKEFRKVLNNDMKKLIRKYNLKELNVAARGANCTIPIEELEKLASDTKTGMYIEEKILTSSEIERLLLISMAKIKENNEDKEITELTTDQIKNADKILLNSFQSQQFLRDGLEYINLFKNPKDRFTLNEYENRILKECLVLPSSIKTTFNSIGGLEKTKEIMNELISLPLKRPELFKTGILKEVTTGILLFGPPGTGKTLSARAVAAQSGANFLNIQMSNIQSKWVGENEKNVKAIFSLSRKLSPCVLFIDEIDALLQTRKGEYTPHYVVNTLNEFMQEWDGLVSDNEGVIVIGATNRPFDLDEAVLRRLPRRIFVSLPDKKARKEILDILLKDEVVGKSKEERDSILDYVAGITNKWSGSDLKNLCIASAFNAIKMQIIDKNKENEVNRTIEKEHFDIAIKSGDIVPSINDRTSIIIQLEEWNSKYGTGADAGGYCGHSTVFGF